MPRKLTLCYHGLSPTWPADISATPARFERQIETILRLGFRPVRFSEIVGASADEKLVAITFDDALRSVVEYGLPVLQRLGAVATLFVPTDYIDAGRPMGWSGIEQWLSGPHEKELIPASWAEIRALAEAGWEIGSHTCSHPHLTAIDDESLARELSESRAVCEDRMSAPCTSIAYPYGDVDQRVIAAAGVAGYRTGAGIPGRADGRDPLEAPRIGVFFGDGDLRFRVKVSALEPLARRAIARG